MSQFKAIIIIATMPDLLPHYLHITTPRNEQYDILGIPIHQFNLKS